jgi:hypothetical protein
MTVNAKRGFRRVAWLATLVAAVLFFALALPLSEHTARYRAIELTENLTASQRREGTAVEVPQVGLVHFPSYMPKTEIETLIPVLFPRVHSATPASASPHIVDLFKVEPVVERRPLWALGWAAAATALLALVLHGTISAVSWVVQGFKVE